MLSKSPSTKSKTLLAEPFGQRLLVISTTLSASHVGQLHVKASALYKCPATRCKNHLESSTRPSI
ncbi:hypothetical protein CWN99_13695 [Vibrio splendidus]|nr:hypothetical protein CWN99_13695 [Vibrio splendidus]